MAFSAKAPTNKRASANPTRQEMPSPSSQPTHERRPHAAMPQTGNTSCSSSSVPSSPSSVLRAQGSILYKQVLEGGFCVTIQRSKLARTLHLYKEALRVSSTADEKASCYKNLGMLQWLFCKVELNQQLIQGEELLNGPLNHVGTKQLSVCKLYLFDAVKSLSEARQCGAKAKPQPWLDHLEFVIKSILEWAMDQTSLLPISCSPLLRYVLQAFEIVVISVELKLLAYKSYADALFKEALSKRQPDNSKDYNACRSLLHECSIHLRKAASFSAADQQAMNLIQEIEELQDSVMVHLCICEAMQAIALGDVCLSEALTDDEEMDMEKVKDSLDYYRQTCLALRELDMETEAVAMSRIGKVYYDVLKMPEQAHRYLFQALRLAMTVISPSIERQEWYRFCLNKVKEHQEEVVTKEAKEWEKSRESVIERLGPKIAALKKAACKGAEGLLKHVYAEHPHPDLKRVVVPCLDSKVKVKGSLKKAILHYHPDSNVQHGEDWKVLCEEITKHLNEKYACFKLCSS